MDIPPAIASFYETLKMILIILDVFFLAFFVFLIVKGWKFRARFKGEPHGERVYTLGNVVLQERWESIIGRSKINSPESLKLAILDADNMVNELLDRMGYGSGGGIGLASKERSGATMADKLENMSPDDFQTLDRLWSAHRVRNKIVHEPGFTITQEEAHKVIADYGSFLKEIGVIDQK